MKDTYECIPVTKLSCWAITCKSAIRQTGRLVMCNIVMLVLQIPEDNLVWRNIPSNLTWAFPCCSLQTLGKMTMPDIDDIGGNIRLTRPNIAHMHADRAMRGDTQTQKACHCWRGPFTKHSGVKCKQWAPVSCHLQ